MLELITGKSDNCQLTSLDLDEIARQGALQMLAKALREEVTAYVNEAKDERDENGKAMVVRNGTGKERTVVLGGGALKVKAPRVYDRRDGEHFTSSILPPFMRKSPNVQSLLPVLYLKGLSTKNFSTALESILGEGTRGLSPSSIVALKKSWESDFAAWSRRSIEEECAYIWADGVNVKVRLGDDKKLCLLVIMGVNQSGEKKLLAIEPGYRESKESWSCILRDLVNRGLREPKLAIGDGALGFWAAVRDVFPGTREQRCWVHKIANVLDCLPKRIQSKAKGILHEMMRSETEKDAMAELERFKDSFDEKYPKAVEKLEKDWSELMTYRQFPAKHWVHLRTTNPIESTFATVKLRTTVTKGAGSPNAAATMAFKLMLEAEKRWRKIRGHELVGDVLKGVEYQEGNVVAEKSRREDAA